MYLQQRKGGLIGSLEAMRRRETHLAEENEAIDVVVEIMAAARDLLAQIESCDGTAQLDSTRLERALENAPPPPNKNSSTPMSHNTDG